MAPKKTVEINAVELTNGEREVAIFIPGIDSMILLSPNAARMMAFRLVECADFIQPPFDENQPAALPPGDTPEDESESLFGPYEETEPDDEEEDE